MRIERRNSLICLMVVHFLGFANLNLGARETPPYPNAEWSRATDCRGTGEFYILGSGLTLNFIRDPDVDSSMAGISSVEQVSRHEGKWTTERWLNGDQTNQGRQLLLDAHIPHIYRVRLYTIQAERAH